jgi:sugar phosphate isomerase/epimerase
MTDRISIVTDEISRDLGVCRAFLDEHSVRAVELRVVGEGRVPDLAPADLATLEAWAANADPAILGVSPGIFKCDVSNVPEARRHLTEILPRAIDLALDLKAAFLVAFTFENLEALPIPVHALECLAEAAAACAGAGLPLLIENEPGFLACRGEETAALLEAVGHDNLCVNWDPANAGDLSTSALSAGLRAIFSRVRHVHVKNGRVRPGERFPAYGRLREGDIDWPAQLALLAELGYDGFLGLETHFEPLVESSAAVLSELRAMLKGLEEHS